jgi:hypothetical protein
MVRFASATSLALLLAACAGDSVSNRPMATATGPSVITGLGGGGAPFTPVAGPPGCAGPISDYLRLIDSDAETGHLNPGVYNRLRTDLDPVKATCAAGREAEARNQLAALKARYGYR